MTTLLVTKRMVDHPGLVSPEVVSFNRIHRGGFATVGFAMDTDWLVLRPDEVATFDAKIDGLPHWNLG